MKKKLIRMLALVLCFCALLSFAACGKDAPAQDDDITPPVDDTTTDEPSTDQPDEPTADDPPTEPDMPTEPDFSETTVRQSLYNVLLGKAEIYSKEYDAQMSLTEYFQRVNNINADDVVSCAFGIADMDSDGALECIINLYTNSDYDENLYILHYDGFKVCAFHIKTSDFYCITEDGISYTSSKIKQICFENDEMEVKELASVRLSGGNLLYYVNDVSVTREEYSAFAQPYFLSNNLRWHEFDEVVIEKFVLNAYDDSGEYYVPIMHITPPFEDARIAIRGVLLDGDKLYNNSDETQVSLLEYCITKGLCAQSGSLESLQFALVDLNTDGVNECIVSAKNNSSDNYVILFYDGSQVRGYNPSPDELSDIKADGTALAQTSVVSAYFDYYQLKYNILTENADSEALANQSSKSDPLWSEINQTDVEKVLGKAEEWSSDEAKAALALYDKVLRGELDTVDVHNSSYYVNEADKQEGIWTSTLDLNNDGVPELYVEKGDSSRYGAQVLYIIDDVVYRDHIFTNRAGFANKRIRTGSSGASYQWCRTYLLSPDGLISYDFAETGYTDDYTWQREAYFVHDKEVKKEVYYTFVNMIE